MPENCEISFIEDTLLDNDTLRYSNNLSEPFTGVSGPFIYFINFSKFSKINKLIKKIFKDPHDSFYSVK